MTQIAEEYAPLVDDYMPDKLRKSLGFSPLSDTLLQIHRPPENADVREWNRKRGAVHKRLIFDDFFALQLVLAQRRKNVKTQAGIQMERLNGLATRFYRNFKYKLTGDQKQALLDIVEDLCGTSPMSRMLQGDVGSGKTVVAILSALLVVENGYQVALMAPTEILAEQHYRNLLKHLPEGIEAVLLTGGKKEKEKQAIKKRIKHGDSAIVVGTHALIQQSVDFHKLAYVIVDEQHRFGVRQRSALVQKGVHPHSLVMTATPIPRSLSMTLYGDLDLSIIREKPAGRSPVRTHIVEEEQRPAMWRAVHRELEHGGQAYIVLPLIEESEKLELKNALEEYDRHRRRFQNYPVGLLHGRMKSEEKEQVDGRIPEGNHTPSGRNDGHRGRRGCSQRDGDGDRERGTLRTGTASPTSRANRPWHESFDLLFMPWRRRSRAREARNPRLQRRRLPDRRKRHGVARSRRCYRNPPMGKSRLRACQPCERSRFAASCKKTQPSD